MEGNDEIEFRNDTCVSLASLVCAYIGWSCFLLHISDHCLSKCNRVVTTREAAILIPTADAFCCLLV